MERREFLIGLFGTAAAALTPQLIEAVIAASPQETWESFMRQWYLDSMPVFVEYQTNVMIFGIGALKVSEVYPYVESIHPRDIMKPRQRHDEYYDRGLELMKS